MESKIKEQPERINAKLKEKENIEKDLRNEAECLKTKITIQPNDTEN